MTRRARSNARAILAAAVLALAPLAAARASDLPDLSSETQTFSATAGTIVGAASQCREISGARIVRATQQVSRALETVGTADDVAQARGRFTDNLQPGRDAVRSGALTCAQVEAELVRLEHLGDRAAHQPR